MELTLIDKIVLASEGGDGLRIAEIDWSPGDFEALRLDVLSLIESEEGSDVAMKNHATHWTSPTGKATQYNILSPHGEYDNPTGSGLTTQVNKFPESMKYPYLAKFVDSFPHAVNMRINVFGGKSGLSQHKETVVVRQKSGKLGLKVRCHFPIQTDWQATVFLEGEIHHLEVGKLYYFNNGCVHAARNEGLIPRIHIVFDMILSEQVAKEFFGNYEVPEPLSREPIDQDAPVDGPSRWDGKEEIHWFEPQ